MSVVDPLARGRSSHALAALAPSLLAFAWLASKASWFWQSRPDLQFGWIVLALCAFLVWDGWARRPALLLRFDAITALLAVLGMAVMFVFQIYTASLGLMAASLSGLAVGVYLLAAANIRFVFGTPGWRHFGFAFLFFLISLPMPSMIYDPIVNGLQAKVATVNVEVLNLIGIPATQVGSLIRLPKTTVGIDEACSGIRSLQSTVMATLFIGYITLKARFLQGVLFVSGIVLAIVGNLLRSLYLSLTANASGGEGVRAVHDAAGWSILIFTAVGVIFLAWLMTKLETRAAEYRDQSIVEIRKAKQANQT